MDEFTNNLLRAITAELHLGNLMRASTELYGKTFWDLEPAQQGDLQKRVLEPVAAIYNLLTSAFLSPQGNADGPPFGTPPSTTLQ
jgi:hypothetical protein